ncbi:Nnf1-domain-containing protein [Parathielavia appendiculata]|uniref:Nnf1-domain-containing protein n=1 Tax=Parathielavia appendiculata TaxID=2587402 RepID=A0AAN6U135_9PEZI|nr:Nnf1-domain-containing protein [Parathielavia appendiculata]
MSSEQDPGPAADPQRRPRDADTEMPDRPSTAAAEPPSAAPQSINGNASSSFDPATQEQRSTANQTTLIERQQQQEQKEKTPPPAPGPRAARLQALFASTAKHTLDKINKDNFAACFPTVAAKAPHTLEFVQRQMVERLGGLWNKEFETIMANRQVVARLNELEALVADATRRRMDSTDPSSPPVAPHTLPAATILQAHLRPHLQTHRTRLTTLLQTTRSANAQLWDEIQSQRAEMEALVADVEKAVHDMDGANELLSEVVDEIAVETRAADGDVRAVLDRNIGG